MATIIQLHLIHQDAADRAQYSGADTLSAVKCCCIIREQPTEQIRVVLPNHRVSRQITNAFDKDNDSLRICDYV